jgi:hypothetical protein
MKFSILIPVRAYISNFLASYKDKINAELFLELPKEILRL